MPCTMAGRTSVRCRAVEKENAVTGIANQGLRISSEKKSSFTSLKSSAPSIRASQAMPTNRALNASCTPSFQAMSK